MKRIIIAGGIGAGKTAITDWLRLWGFTVVDADVVAHHVTEPGQPALEALRDAFGDAVLDEGGRLDRAFVADVVFHDATALRRLNEITHGYIGAEIGREIDAVTGPAVFIALPLFRPEHRPLFRVDEVWSVQVAPEVAIDRLVRYRGFSEDDARSRLANQMSNAERESIVDRVLWNEGSLDDLHQLLDEALRESGVAGG